MQTETKQATTQVTEYRPTVAALANLRQRFENVVFDVSTTKGSREARGARKELVAIRTSLEAKRKELKAPALERARQIDFEARRITGEILALEQPIDEAIKLEEQRKEVERLAKAKKERDRREAIQAKIDELRGPATGLINSLAIDKALAAIEALAVDESFEERFSEALSIKAQSIARLQAMRSEALEREAEAARLQAEREEIERIRAEDEARRAEQARKDAEAKAEAYRVEKARRDAEEAERRKAQAIEYARIAEEWEKAVAEHKAAMQAELDRLADAARKTEADKQERIEREARDQVEEQIRLDIITRREQARLDALDLVRELAQHNEGSPSTSIDELIARAKAIVSVFNADL